MIAVKEMEQQLSVYRPTWLKVITYRICLTVHRASTSLIFSNNLVTILRSKRMQVSATSTSLTQDKTPNPTSRILHLIKSDSETYHRKTYRLLTNRLLRQHPSRQFINLRKATIEDYHKGNTWSPIPRTVAQSATSLTRVASHTHLIRSRCKVLTWENSRRRKDANVSQCLSLRVLSWSNKRSRHS